MSPRRGAPIEANSQEHLPRIPDRLDANRDWLDMWLSFHRNKPQARLTRWHRAGRKHTT
jgi:hypothetical protein